MPKRLKADQKPVTLEKKAPNYGGTYRTSLVPGQVVPNGFEDLADGDAYEDVSEEEVAAASSSLPADFPHRDLLAASFPSAEAVTSASDDDLSAIDGIGPKGLKAIRSYKPSA